jgi:glycosyltransferase involved in cell wall biosynthesis
MNCVIICDNTDLTGGVSSVIIAQAAGLKSAGYKVFIFAAYGPTSSLISDSAEEVVCLYPEYSRRNRFSEIWNTYASAKLSDYLIKFSARDTIIHIHALSLGISSSIAISLRKNKIPYVITAHDAGWICPTGYFYNFHDKSYCTYKPLSYSCLTSNCDKKTYAHKIYKLIKISTLDYISRIKNDAHTIISPSKILHDRLAERIPNSTPIVTILNPVNTIDNGERLSVGKSFLFVGRIWEEKGINELLETIGNYYPLTIVGDGPSKIDLEKKYPKVLFKGWLSPEDVLVEMKKCIALILPSIYLEAFGLVVAEALSQGIPVIVSDRAGSATMIEHGHNGFIVNMDNLNEIKACCDLLLDANYSKKMSSNAYKKYWENPLSNERYISSLLDIFNRISNSIKPTMAG